MNQAGEPWTENGSRNMELLKRYWAGLEEPLALNPGLTHTPTLKFSHETAFGESHLRSESSPLSLLPAAPPLTDVRVRD
jgi:hypothetical protein